MRVVRRAAACAALSAFFIFAAGEAAAQTAVDYRFLEVLDVEKRPVAGASLKALGSGGEGPLRTDANGIAQRFPVYYGDYNTVGVEISKPGYITQQETEIRDLGRHSSLMYGEVPQYDPRRIRVVLLKEPKTDAERRAVEAEQRRREMLAAVKRSDAANVERLLRAGASPETRDVYGIPAVLFAAANGDLQTIKALLAAGADVRNKGRPGRKALLYYMDSLNDKCAADVETVRTLVKAGADVNAVASTGHTVLSLSLLCANSPVRELLERAGARLK